MWFVPKCNCERVLAMLFIISKVILYVHSATDAHARPALTPQFVIPLLLQRCNYSRENAQVHVGVVYVQMQFKEKHPITSRLNKEIIITMTALRLKRQLIDR